jgi:hypothetical protein
VTRRAVLAAALILVVTVALPVGATAATGLRVSGNRLIAGPGAGQPVQLRGVNRSGLEFACIQGWGLTDGPRPGRIDSPAMIAAMRSWDIDVVRVPLNEDCWLGLHTRRGLGGRPYRRAVAAYVRKLRRAGLYVILDLHWTAPGRARAVQQLPMPDRDHAGAFWRSVARAFRGDDDVIFDLFNEPFDVGWRCWLRGCRIRAGSGWRAYRAVGMQALIGAVRRAGARQPLLIGGPGYASDVEVWERHAPRDPLGQLVVAQHNYGGLSPCGPGCRTAVAAVTRRHPVLFSELGETDCAHGYIDRMMDWADGHGIGYLGWAWDATSSGWSCRSGPALISDWQGTPTRYGIGLRDHLRALGPAIPAALP